MPLTALLLRCPMAGTEKEELNSCNDMPRQPYALLDTDKDVERLGQPSYRSKLLTVAPFILGTSGARGTPRSPMW